MLDWETAGRSVDALTARAHPWAVDVALILIAGGAVAALLIGMTMAIRRMLGMGATKAEVAELLDQKINGSLVRLERAHAAQAELLGALDGKVDQHGERLASLEGFLSKHQSWNGVERRRRDQGG